MSNSSRSPVTGRDVAGAGAWLLAVNLVWRGIGALLGALVPLALAGFLFGFLMGIRFVAKRFHDL